MNRFRRTGVEILYPRDAVVTVAAGEIGRLIEMARNTPRRRMRICAHPDVSDPIHEMLIVHFHGNYVPPHRHLDKSESFHVIEGRLSIILFADDGQPTRRIDMSPFGAGGIFYYRVPPGVYHSIIVRSDHVVFHETTGGPFRKNAPEPLTWAPGETSGADEQAAYLAGLAAWAPEG